MILYSSKSKLIRKTRFLLSLEPRRLPDDDSAEIATNHASGAARSSGSTADQDQDGDGERSGMPPGHRKKWSKEEKKKRSGANKGRRFGKVRDEVELCWKVAVGNTCEFGEECVLPAHAILSTR